MSCQRISHLKIIFAASFLILMTALGSVAVWCGLTKKSSDFSALKIIAADYPVISSFKMRYPFDESEKMQLSQWPPPPRQNRFLRYLKKISGSTYVVELNTTIRNPLPKYFLMLIAVLDNITGNDVIENGNTPIVRLPNGYLTYPYSDTRESWESVQKWNFWLKKRNIPLVLLLPATKMDDGITAFPPIVPRGYADMMERYKTFLSQNEIPYLDAKEHLLAANGNFYSWFYRTDHHWNVLAGRLIAEETARKLHEELRISADADAAKEANFTLTRYPAVFRGSMNFKAGAPPEDFEIFFQRKESRFHLQIPTLGINRSGGFNHTLIAQPYLKRSDTYSTFSYGTQPLIRIENKDCANGTRILIVKESQADVVCPYLACTVQYLDVIDHRHFDGSIKSFIEQTSPDVVVICI